VFFPLTTMFLVTDSIVFTRKESLAITTREGHVSFRDSVLQMN